MERGFYNEDFEQLIKQKADQYRMYPSGKVWKGVFRSLHKRRKWYWFSFILFLAGISYITYTQLNAPVPSKPLAAGNTSNSNEPSENNNTNKGLVVPFTTAKANRPKIDQGIKLHSFAERPEIDNSTSSDISSEPDKTIANNEAIASKTAPVFNLQTRRLKEELKPSPDDKIAIDNENYPRTFSTGSGIDGRISENDPITIALNKPEIKDELAKEDIKRSSQMKGNAAYELQVPPFKRLSWQFTFTPAVNYRRLIGSDYASIQAISKNIPLAPGIEGNPNNLVNHKPAIGFELGSNFIYALNKDFSVRAGFQFNYSRYDIQAYGTYLTDRATITLNNTQDVLTSYTSLRNFSGDNVQSLRNQYFEFSLPVGLEYRLWGNDKIQLNVAGTLQPTYLLNHNTYLITTDFENYTKEPSLVRRWNLNTSAEIFLSYKTGGLKWQVGPQFRYQLFSSYVNKYPIHEYLMEYGIKIGVAKTIR
jgi:hypothetical protein